MNCINVCVIIKLHVWVRMMKEKALGRRLEGGLDSTLFPRRTPFLVHWCDVSHLRTLSLGVGGGGMKLKGKGGGAKTYLMKHFDFSPPAIFAMLRSGPIL